MVHIEFKINGQKKALNIPADMTALAVMPFVKIKLPNKSMSQSCS